MRGGRTGAPHTYDDGRARIFVRDEWTGDVVESAGLQDILAEWTDFDWAGFRLGRFLGVIPADRSFTSVKGSFWIDGFPLGIMLDEMLESLVKAGFLEKNEDLQYRWNPVQPDIDQPLDEEPLPPLR